MWIQGHRAMIAGALAVGISAISAPLIAEAAPVELEAVTPLVGDGATQARLFVQAPSGTRLKVTPTRGRFISTTPVRGGHIIVWVPPKVSKLQEVGIDLKVRGGGIKSDLRISPTVAPSWASGFSITADPAVIGPGERATLTVVPKSDSPAGGQRKLAITASSGTIGQLVPTGDGKWVAQYTAPSRLSGPIQPVFAVVDRAAPSQALDRASLKVKNKTNLSFEVAPDSVNMLKVGSTEYGPINASAAGTVSFSVDLLPGQTTGTLTSTVAGTPTTTRPTLPIDSPYQVAIATTPGRAGGSSVIEVPVACLQPNGRACPASALSVEASAGKVGRIQQRDQFLIVPVTLPDSGTTTVSVSAGEGEQSTTQTRRISAVPGPLRMTLVSDPPRVDPDKPVASVIARAKDAEGNAVTGRLPVISVRGGQLVSRTKDNQDGSYSSSWRMQSGKDWMEAVAIPKVGSSGLAPTRLLMWPTASSINADGISKVTVFIIAEDAVGLPVPNLNIDLTIPAGDGLLPPTVNTGRSGIAQVEFTAGTTGGAVLARASLGALSAQTRVWQVGPRQSFPGTIDTGSQSTIDAIAKWRQRIPALIVSKANAKASAPSTRPATETTTSRPSTSSSSSPSAAADPGASSAVPEKERKVGYKTFRLRGLATNHIGSYSSSLVGLGAEVYAPDAAYSTIGQTGIRSELEFWVLPDQSLGFFTNAGFSALRLGLGASKAGFVPLDMHAGFRYRASDNGTWSTHVGGGFRYANEVVFQYATPERTAAIPVKYPVAGLTVNGGFRGEWQDALFEATLSTVWSPAPTSAHLTLRGDIPIQEGFVFSLAGGAEARMSRFIPDTDNRDAKVRTRRAGANIRAGVGVAF